MAHLSFRDAYRLAHAEFWGSPCEEAEAEEASMRADAAATAFAAAEALGSLLDRHADDWDCDIGALIDVASRLAAMRDEVLALLGEPAPAPRVQRLGIGFNPALYVEGTAT